MRTAAVVLVLCAVASMPLRADDHGNSPLVASPIDVGGGLLSACLETGGDMDYFREFDLMNEAFARLCTTRDAKEGVKAFFERRNPTWELR